MSQSITFQQFDKEKTDALWDDVLSGKYELENMQRKEVLEKQLPELQAKIPKYNDLDFMFYSKDPRLEEYNKAQSEYDKISEQARRYNSKLIGLNEFKQKIQSKDKHEALWAIEAMDAQLMSECGKSYGDNASEIEFYTEVLFKGVLGVDIHEQMKEGEGFETFPFKMWVKVFNSADPATMQGVKKAFNEAEYSFEEFSYIILNIKEVVKVCIDTNTEMITYYDTDSSEFQKTRAKMLYDLVMNKKEDF